jgi:hypothetical protein
MAIEIVRPLPRFVATGSEIAPPSARGTGKLIRKFYSAATEAGKLEGALNLFQGGN